MSQIKHIGPLIMFGLVLSGCALQRSETKVLVSEGCLITVETTTYAQAKEILRMWDLDEDCELKVETSTSE